MLGFFFDGWSLTAIAVSNAILAWVAACVHGWAAYKTSGHIRQMFISIAALATFYSFAYWWLAFNTDRSADWSNFLRPFGIFTWVVAWAFEPIVLVHYLQRSGNKIVAQAQEAADQVKGKLDG